MKKHLFRILRDSVFYGSIGTTSKLASLFITPIVVRVFDAADYGAVDALRVLSLVLVGMSLFALEQSAARNITLEEDIQKKREIAGQALVAAFLCTLVVVSTAVSLAEKIVSLLFDEATDETVSAIYLLALAIPGSICNAFALMLLRWNFRRIAYTFCALGGTILLLVATLFFVVHLRMGIRGVFVAQLVSSFFPIIMLVVFCRQYIQLPSRIAAWRLVKFAFPLTLMSQASNLQPMIERVVILRLIGLEGLGIFSVAQTAARAGKFPADSLYMAWYPYYSNIFREKGTVALERIILIGYAFLAILYVAVVHFFSEPIIRLFAGIDYLPAADLLAVIVAGLLLEVGASLLGIKVLLVGQSGRWATLYLGQGLAFVGFSFLLVSEWGLMGIAYAFLGSRTLYFIAACYKSYRVGREVRALAAIGQ